MTTVERGRSVLGDIVRPGAVTGVGSLPHRSAHDAAAFALREYDLPAIPTLPRRSPAEGMIAQAVVGIGGVALGQYGSVAVDVEALDPDAPVHTDLANDAFTSMRTFLATAAARGMRGPVKWQFVGPVTLGAALTRVGVPADRAFAVAAGAVRAHVSALAAAVAEALPASPQLVWLDEPWFGELMLPGFPIAPEPAIDLLSGAMAVLEPVATVGVHCCAGADIASLLDAGPAVLSVPVDDKLVDVAGYLTRFLHRGGRDRMGRRVHGRADRHDQRAGVAPAQRRVVRAGRAWLRPGHAAPAQPGDARTAASACTRRRWPTASCGSRARSAAGSANKPSPADSHSAHNLPRTMSESDRDVAARVAALSELVAYHNRRYHELDDPEISDGDFDLLVRELRRLEAEHPELVTEDSAGQAVGGAPSALFAPVVHSVPMTEPRQRDDRRGAGGVGPARRPRPARRAGALRLRAEDRRRGDERALRGRPVRAGGHARRRTRRRGRHGQRGHHRRRPADVEGRSRGRRCSRSAARCTCRSPASSG